MVNTIPHSWKSCTSNSEIKSVKDANKYAANASFLKFF